MDALRARLSRRLALRRAEEGEADEDAARSFWQSLSAEERRETLEFDDRAVVQRMHDHMSALCHAEIWCTANGMSAGGSSGSTAPSERLRNFQFERLIDEVSCTGCMSSPITFVARPELAESETLFEYLAQQLGSGFLKGRPVLQRRDWCRVLDAKPASWHNLEVQALQLVELAIYHRYKDSIASSAAAASASTPAAATSQDSAAAAKPDKKKRNRKKKAKAQTIQTSEVAEDAPETVDADEQQERQPQEEDEDSKAAVQNEETREEEEEETREDDEKEVNANGGAVAKEEKNDETNSAKPSPGWQMSTFRDGAREWLWSRTPWAWDADGANGCAQVAATGIRVVVRNTFVDVIDTRASASEPSAKRRGRSAMF